MKRSLLIIPAVLFVLSHHLFLSGCTAGKPSTLEFTGGLLELTFDDQSVVPRSLYIQGESRQGYPLVRDARFRSPWVTLPRGCSLELGYAFSFSAPSDKARPLERRHITVRFRARLHFADGGIEDLFDRTCASNSLNGWQDETVDLSAHAGQRVRLELDCPVCVENAPGKTRDVEPVFSVPCLFSPVAATAAEGQLLLLISLDSLRADALGCAGYQRFTSPHLDRFSREAVHYPTCLSPSPWTRPSHMSLLTSLYPQVHGLDRDPSDLNLSSSYTTWAEIFKAAGYQTLGITGGGFVHPSHGFERGFRSLHIGRRNLSLDCRQVILALRKWRNADLFFFLHTFATHAPYNLHGQLNYHGASVTNKMRRVSRKKMKSVSPAQRRNLRRCYDDGIFYADHCLGRLFRTLRMEGLYDKAMIIVLSDHGESFWEHGVYGHSTQVYEHLLKVPLLVKYPREIPRDRAPLPGTVIRRQVELLDLLPTAVDVFGIDTTAVGQFTGRSLLEVGDGSRDWSYAETWQLTPGLKSIRTGNLSYILHRKSGLEELFDLATDPDQQHNLARQGRKEDLAAARARLGLAESLCGAGLHLAAGDSGDHGKGLSGRLRAGCRISEVNAFFPQEVGAVDLSPDGRELRFVFHHLGKIPFDLGFELEDPGAMVSLNLDPGAPDQKPAVIVIGQGEGGGDLPVSAEDQSLTLAWSRFPGMGAMGEAGGAWVQIYRRSAALAGEKTALTERETAMLKELGYLE